MGMPRNTLDKSTLVPVMAWCRQATSHYQNIFKGIFKGIFFNENVWIPIKISLKFDPKGPINNIPALVQIKAWRLRQARR